MAPRREGGTRPPALGAARARRRRARAEPRATRSTSSRPGSPARHVHRVPVGPGRRLRTPASRRPGIGSQPQPARAAAAPSRTTRRRRASEPGLLQRLVDFCREREIVLVHDFAYADLAFDGYRPPSIFEAEGARGGRRRALLADEGLLARRLADRRSSSGVPDVVAGARAAEVVPRLRQLPAAADRGDRRAARGARPPGGGRARSTAAAATRSATGSPRAGWNVERPRGDDVRLGADPDRRAVRRSSRCGCSARPAWSSSAGQRLRPRRRGTSSASRSSRTSNGSRRPCAGSGGRSHDPGLRPARLALSRVRGGVGETACEGGIVGAEPLDLVPVDRDGADVARRAHAGRARAGLREQRPFADDRARPELEVSFRRLDDDGAVEDDVEAAAVVSALDQNVS